MRVVSASSPIAGLPTELLSEIFQLCNLSVEQTEADMEGENSCMLVNPFGLEFTLSLATVCKKWRNIIYNQANLWSNICITQNILRDHSGSTQLDTTQIEICLQKSRGFPLNILIDARDPEWNWTEEGVGMYADEMDEDDEFAMEIDPEEALMPVLFTSAHMVAAVTPLLAHLARWKSLVILTDTYAPMHAAMQIINPAISQRGAPLLDTLALLRCNELPSYFPEFQPAALKDTAFLTGVARDPSANLLPRLRHLSLEGVHADWDALVATLTASSGTLKNLELRYHSEEVRPTLPQFRRLLGAAPALEKLSLKCSGAHVPSNFVLPPNYVPVALPALRDLVLGYQTAADGEMTLEIFAAQGVSHLTLEDRSHYAAASQDADDMLAYLASKASYSTLAPIPPSPGPRGSCAAPSPSRAYFSADPLPPFPALTSVALTKVDATAPALHAFFRVQPRLETVSLSSVSPDAFRALLPSVGPQGPVCACPLLRSVRVCDAQKEAKSEWDYYLNAMERERPAVEVKIPSEDGCSDTSSLMLSEDDEEEAIEVPANASLHNPYSMGAKDDGFHFFDEAVFEQSYFQSTTVGYF